MYQDTVRSWRKSGVIKRKQISPNSYVRVYYKGYYCTAESIADYFANKYKELYNSVAYNYQEMSGVQKEINHLIYNSVFNTNCIITSDDIVSGIMKLKPGKNDWAGGISSDHVVNAGIELYPHITSLFSCILTHVIATGDLFISTVIPIPKARNANLTSADNYRGIALSAILGKLFDLIVLM